MSELDKQKMKKNIQFQIWSKKLLCKSNCNWKSLEQWNLKMRDFMTKNSVFYASI